MTTDKRHDSLILDLLALYRRYGKHEIEKAISSLRSGAALDRILTLTTEVGKKAERLGPVKSRAQKASKKKNPRDFLQQSIAELESKNDPEMNNLVEFLRASERGEYLTTGRAIRALTAELQLEDLNPKHGRFVILRRLGESLRDQPATKRNALIEFARELENRGPSSLQGWSDLIVKK